MFLHYMWTLDNYLTLLAVIGFIIYFILSSLGWLFEQVIDYSVRGWRWAKAKLFNSNPQ